MRKAAVIILLAFGILILGNNLFYHARGGMITAWTSLGLPAFGAVLLGGGISASRMRVYWLAFSAAICMVVYGIIIGVGNWQSPPLDTPSRVLLAAATAGFWVIPGLLALIFLVKRRGEFQS